MDMKSLCMTFNETVAMLVHTSNKVAGHADVNRASWPTRKNVEIELAHAPSLPKRDGRDKPGHDEEREFTGFVPAAPYLPLRVRVPPPLRAAALIAEHLVSASRQFVAPSP